VLGSRGEVVAALGVSGPTPRLEERFDEIGPLLENHARELTELLQGHTHEEGAA
jgi:DNA-binding IclR family transcriptional regulator